MTGTERKVHAVALTAVMVFSVFAAVTVPADAKLLSGGNASVSQTGSAEDVVVNDATIDTTTSTTIEVAYDTTLSTSDIEIVVTNDDTNDVIATKTSGFTAQEDTVSITIPDSSTTGVPDTSDFIMKIGLVDSGVQPPVASDTASVTVEPAPSISGVALGEASGDMAFVFDSDEQLGSNAGDVAVTVSGPNGKAYSFDRNDFSETDNGDGTYTYTLATTQAYDDGDGTYTASVDDALDSAGANGGNNGGGSGLSDTYDTSDTTSPTVSNVNLGESGGDLVLTFDSDEQLGGSASDLTVTVDSPNTGTDWQTFDWNDFSETQNKDGSYTYSLTTTQAYDDGSGSYTATVDDAFDSAGNNGGVNGDGSGLTDTYDTNDNTAPPISSVSLSESSGSYDISFDSDEQLGTQSGDVTVEVTGPNGATATFDRSQFSESGSGPYTYSLTGGTFSDGDGIYTVEIKDAKDSAGNNGGTSGEGNGLTNTYDYSDTTAPSISSVTLKDSGSGTLTLSFVSDEQLDSDAGDIKVSVDAPNAGSDWKGYYRNDFIGKQTQSGNFKYTLVVQQGFDSGTGTYTLTVDDARDSSDNNGGENGQGTSLTDSHTYNPSGSTPEIVSKDIEYESGPAKFQSDVEVEKNIHWNTKLTSQSLQFDLWVDQDEITSTDSKRDLTLSPVGFTDTTNITLRMTVKNYDPDIMMGPANVSSWSVTDKSGSKKEVVVTLHPSVVQRNFNAPFSPSQWDSSKQSYKKSWEQADVGVDAFVGLQTAQMGQGGLSKLSGARLNTDAQAFTTPTTSNGRLVFNVAAPHCKVGAKTDPNDPAADDECNDKYVNNDGFYEAVIPKAFWKDQWGSGLNADNMSIVYKNDGTEETLTNIEVTKRQSGALYVEAKGIHYSSGDLETVEDTTDPTADAGSDTSVTVGTSVSFDGTSSSDSETSVTSYEWDVDGDGTYEKTGSKPSHSYSSPGTYTVTLKVEDGGSNVETDTMTVTVSDTTGPTASVGSDTTVTVGTAVTFDGSTSTDNVGVTSYEWDVDGDGTTDATGAAPSHTFATAGTYDVTLTVKDAAGNTDTATRTVTVADKSVPTASVGADTTVDVGAAVTFDGSGSADNVAVTSYEWDVDGDGTVDATGATATHTYASAGTYTATLTVTDDAGNSDTATRTVTVEATDDDTTGPPVEVTARSGQTDVVVRAHSGDVSVDLAHAGSETGNVSADSVAFDTTEPEAFTLNVSTPASADEAGVPDPEPSDVGTVVGYVQVDHTVSDADLSAVSLDVTVGWDALADGPSGGDIVVYRYHDGEWHPLDTEIDHYSDRGVHLAVDSPGLSVFAVGSERAGAFSVGEATVDATSVTAGESVTVAVPVTNDGTAVDETTLTVTADDRTLTVETVRLLPGQSTTVEIPATFDDPGEYELQVDDRVVDTVTVSAAATATATPSTTATPEPESTATPESTPTAEATPTPDDASPTAGSGPGFGFLVTVVAAVLTALAARWRR